jgi:hypothetical protein
MFQIWKRCFHNSLSVKGWQQFALSGYGLPLSNQYLKPFESKVEFIKNEDFQSNDDIEKYQNKLLKTTKPIIYFSNNKMVNSGGFLLFLSPVNFYITDELLNNEFFGPYEDAKYVYLDKFTFPDLQSSSKNKKEIQNILQLASIDLKTKLIFDKSNKRNWSGYSYNPYQDWLIETDKKLLTLEDCIGYYAVGVC